MNNFATENGVVLDMRHRNVLTPRNMRVAWTRVRNYMQTQSFPDTAGLELFEVAREDNLELIRSLLAEAAYPFQPLRVHYTAKANRGLRMETTSSVFDRVAIQAVFNHVAPALQSRFLNPAICLGYNVQPPETGYIYDWWLLAYRKWQGTIAHNDSAGYTWTLHADIQGFFHNVNLSLLMRILADAIPDKNVCKQIEGYLSFHVTDDTGTYPWISGLPIAEPISRFLGNLYLADFDRYVTEKCRFRYVRYVDDMLFFAQSELECIKIKTVIQEYLSQKRNLYLNESKSRIAHIFEVIKDGGASLALKLSALDERYRAAMAFGTNKKALISDLLALMNECFEDGKHRSRAQNFAAYRLARLAAPKAVSQIAALLEDPSSQRIAATSLALIGTTDSKKRLRSFLTSSTAPTRSDYSTLVMLDAILKYCPEERTLASRFLTHQFWGARALAASHTESSATLIKRVVDPNALVRRNVYLAIAKRGSKSKALAKNWPDLLANEDDRDARLACILMGASLGRSSAGEDRLHAVLDGSRSLEALYAARSALLLSGETINEDSSLIADALDGCNWKPGDFSEFRNTVRLSAALRAKPFIERILGMTMEANSRESLEREYNKAVECVRDADFPAATAAVAQTLRSLAEHLYRSPAGSIKTVKAYCSYLHWQAALLQTRLRRNHWAESARHAAVLSGQTRWTAFASQYGRLIRSFEALYRTDPMDRPRILSELKISFSNLHMTLGSLQANPATYRFEFGLIDRTVLAFLEKLMERFDRRSGYAVSAQMFADLGEWTLHVTNLRNSPTTLESVRLLADGVSVTDRELSIRFSPGEKWTSTLSTRVSVKGTPSVSFVIGGSRITCAARRVSESHVYREVISLLPKPLQKTYEKIWRRRTDSERYRTVIDAYKQLQQYVAFILISEELTVSRGKGKRLITKWFEAKQCKSNSDIGLLKTPSEGHWTDVIGRLSISRTNRRLQKLVSAAADSDTRRILVSLNELKKPISHGALELKPGTVMWKAVALLHDLYSAFRCLAELPLVVIDQIDLRNRRIEGTNLNGLPSGFTKRMVTRNAPTAGYYLVTDQDLLPLAPFLMENAPDDPETMLFYSRRTGTEIEYLDYWTGEKMRTSGDMQAQLQQVRIY